MSDRPLPWSIGGVSDAAQKIARTAAAAAGMTTGAWLSQTLLTTAGDPALRDAVDRLAVRIAARDARARATLAALTDTAAAMERRVAALEAGSGARHG